ncbi:MAG: VRR-NUC domain-containing protein, partial [Mycobacteriaceae bacterium]
MTSPISEAQLQRACIDLIQWLGLAYFHDNDSRRNRRGFPDLVIAGRGGVAYRELKTATGRLRPEQMDWITTLTLAGADVAVWRPCDLKSGRIEKELKQLTKGK